MKKVLIGFGSKGYEQSLQRLYNSAALYFDDIILYGEEDIDREFYVSNIRIFQYRRGWGYWLWKPYLILKTLRKLQENDFCFYTDATSVFVDSPEILLKQCMTGNGILLFDNFRFQNDAWTKMDCFNLMGLSEDKYLYGRQANAAFQLYRKNNHSMAFIEEMLHYATGYHILTDAENITGPNLPAFKDHRHDQSILSLLAIKHNIPLAASPWQYRNVNNLRTPKIIELKRDVTIS